ncbi:carboxylesterase/lipase family protein [Paenibacillus sp. FSL K6-2859]|uniref:carboxylesterase/lipase family protein n=1 Tax=Paenibacillus sp. FSL K6-2859 TaxID=2921482 RepID=UPI0030F57B07
MMTAKNFVCSSTEPIVQTKAGKIRGFQVNGTYTFHGIKYADAKRFQMPTEIAPWEGIKDALAYGYVSPMLTQDQPVMEVLVPHRYWPMDEHCQYLNIWTQSLEPQAKKPVMVWLHGGGFAAGSSIEQVAYEGDKLSEFGDVVVVTLNHRLNILGYMNLSAFGDKYVNSANAGNADMVAALKWVQENITAFGGDPDNVTIFGQSGGGMKVWTLMNTPTADGLFHKGVIQSGLIDGFLDTRKTDSTAIVKALLAELNMGVAEVEKLEAVPYHQLAAAYNKVAPALAMQGEYIGGNPMPNEFYVGDPREVGFTEHAKTIPVLIGSVFGEFAFGPGVPNKQDATEEATMEMLTQKYGSHTENLVAQFRESYPDKHLSDLQFLDTFFRIPTKDFIEKKSVHEEAPTYSYLFAYEFPFEGGKIAWHCAEIPFVFHNTKRVPVCLIPGVSDRMEERICGAWISFARYGNPNIPSLPQWPACKPGDEVTMIFDRNCAVKHNFDHALMDTLLKTNPKLPFLPSNEDEEEGFILH